MKLQVTDLVAGYGDGPDVVRGVSFVANPGKITTLLGPNGCGKSTLLKACSKVLQPRSGAVVLVDEPVAQYDLAELSPRESARRIGMLAQQPVAPAGLAVRDLVARGRHPHRGLFGGLTRKDNDIIDAALQATGTETLANHVVDSLSGGQRQLVWFAMVLAQDTPVILLDEPTTYLDPAHALNVLELARQQSQAGKTVVMVLHDLMLAGAYSDQLVLLKDGHVLADGSPKQVLTSANLAEAYGLRAEIWPNPRSGSSVIVARGTV
ncbi:ABC transporter ATP-binding protein [Corynebacterium epidermidicanis]|uniref:ABC-type cobalamin/Fe3+-siderophore transport system, ATPase component n=1 Tax=Corynebacterium epidermidicanis TaxID=1050174 RepID=A0A0G3GW61_9CORY|nr:ABC transporter ATP-binding protein [Corynebacterium epidermidicanis]AKK03748.1 ABC-type cobalamin/Fe3+-siderophore transport system, ATPase component [Corynebacterium epidermidicanis]